MIEQPFTAWDDFADYFLAPDGSFSGGAASWTLTGAEVTGDENPYVALPAEGSATSPSICVAEDDPTMRFFAQGQGELQVEVLYTDGEGTEQSLRSA